MPKLLSTITLALVLSACAGTAEKPAAPNDKTVAASTDAEETKIVCRRQQSTGFRLKTRVCKPANEW